METSLHLFVFSSFCSLVNKLLDHKFFWWIANASLYTFVTCVGVEMVSARLEKTPHMGGSEPYRHGPRDHTAYSQTVFLKGRHGECC
jgi:hypothetical protein